MPELNEGREGLSRIGHACGNGLFGGLHEATSCAWSPLLVHTILEPLWTITDWGSKPQIGGDDGAHAPLLSKILTLKERA